MILALSTFRKRALTGSHLSRSSSGKLSEIITTWCCFSKRVRKGPIFWISIHTEHDIFITGKFYELYESDADIGHQEFDLKITDRVKMRMGVLL
jgi:hypothetical protein